MNLCERLRSLDDRRRIGREVHGDENLLVHAECLRLDTARALPKHHRVVRRAQHDCLKQCESRERPVQSQPMWKVLVVFVVLIVGALLIWVNAGKAAGPAIEINGPSVIGRTGEIAVSVVTPKAALKRLEIALVQDSTTAPVFSLT